jgi:hypothetical protein
MWLRRRTEAFKHPREQRDIMSQATKIVLGTIGVSAVLAFALVALAAFAPA